MTRTQEYVAGNIFHLYNRGNKKELTFCDSQDYKFYLSRLERYAKETNFEILCYCLMPNHFHICAEQFSGSGPDKLIQKLHTSYSMYFNRKYKSVGHVFQRNFRYKLVATDSYLIYLSSYIHLNPVDLGFKDPANYPYSSYKEYLISRPGFCKRNKILRHFRSIKKYHEFIESMKIEKKNFGKWLENFQEPFGPE